MLAKFPDLAADSLVKRLVVRMSEHLADPTSDGAHLRLAHAARGQRGRTDADAARVHRLPGVKGNHVLVDRDADAVESLFGDFAG